MTPTAPTALFQRPGVQQFVKFCIIGATSTAIDIAITYLLVYYFGINQTRAKTISFMFSVSNGFFWNSRWTFRGMGSGKLHEMYVKFIAVNAVGFIINLTIFTLVQSPFSGRFFNQPKPAKPVLFLALLVATGCASVWNFLAARKWTFKSSGA